MYLIDFYNSNFQIQIQPRGLLRQYREENFLKALIEVSNQNLNVSKAAKKYGVPRTTLSYKMNNKNASGKIKPGTNKIFFYFIWRSPSLSELTPY